MFGERHGLDLIVGDEDHRRLQALVKLGKFDAGTGPQGRIEIGERLVEQEGLRLLDDRTADGDTLALTTRELARLALEQVRHFKDAGGLVDPRVDGLARHADILEPECHVVAHAHMWIKRIGLEHHGNAALARRQMIDTFVIDGNLAAIDRFEARDHSQKRRFPAAGRSEKHDEFACLDGQRQVIQHRHGTEMLAHIPDLNMGRHVDAPAQRMHDDGA